ncbi:MAG: hypothetical protein JXB23_18065 [Candidatus Aminicenantes bacterium]|nr:hypothetical protein [Candidatus Aminicenantes bacterium]
MKGLYLFVSILMAVACINQTIHQDVNFLQNFSFDEVWEASIRAVNDIDFTIDSVDKESGFISAESGTRVFQNAPPRLSVMIADSNGRVAVDCKVLQKEQFVDVFGYGKSTVRKFMSALRMNLMAEPASTQIH